MATLTTREARLRRHRRVRGKIAGTAERPRLMVFRSNKGVFAQLVDDDSGKTLAGVGWTNRCRLDRVTTSRGRSADPRIFLRPRT